MHAIAVTTLQLPPPYLVADACDRGLEELCGTGQLQQQARLEDEAAVAHLPKMGQQLLRNWDPDSESGAVADQTPGWTPADAGSPVRLQLMRVTRFGSS